MKARMPFHLKQNAMQMRQYMVWLQSLLTCYTLHRHFGFGRQRLMRYLVLNGEDASTIAEMAHGYAENRTWMDELWHWGEEMGLNDLLNGRTGGGT